RRAAARSRRNSSISATRVDPTSRVTRTGMSVRPPKPPTDRVRRHLDLLRGDRSTERAKETLARGERLVTSDHVLVETWLLLGHRLGRNAAERWVGSDSRWRCFRGTDHVRGPRGGVRD